MTTFSSLLIFCATLYSSVISYESMELAEIEKKLAIIDSSMQLSRDILKIPGMAVGIIVDGKVVLTKGYGVLDDSNRMPVTTSSLFAIASCTKAFTTFLLGLLVDEGLLNWDDPVISHIPEFRLNDDYRTHHVTIRDLISHRTGQPRHESVWVYANFQRDELLERIPHLQPNYQLREKYQYNNIMFTIAGIVAERVTGQSWEDLIRSRIFAPLGLTRSNCSIKDPKELEEFATGHSERDGKVVSAPWADLTVVGPGGSIVSTIDEMTKWAQVHLRVTGQDLIQNETLDEIHTIQMAVQNTPKAGNLYFGYAFGWATTFYRGRYRLLHNGETDGYTSRIALLPEEKIGAVILANSDCHRKVFFAQVLDRIFDILLDLSVPSPQEWATSLAKPEEQQKEAFGPGSKTFDPVDNPDQFVGKYFNPGYGFVEIRLNGSQLHVLYNTRDFVLKPGKRSDVFEAKSLTEDQQYECSFSHDRWGDVHSCTFNFESKVPPILFEKEIPREYYDPEYLKKFIGSYRSPDLSVTIRMDKRNRLKSSSGTLEPRRLNVFYLEGSPTSYYEFIVLDDGSVSELNVYDAYEVTSLEFVKN